MSHRVEPSLCPFRKFLFNQRPSQRITGIPFYQAPHAMHVVWQEYPRLNRKGMSAADHANNFSDQRPQFFEAKNLPPLIRNHSEKISVAFPRPLIIWHFLWDGIFPPLAFLVRNIIYFGGQSPPYLAPRAALFFHSV